MPSKKYEYRIINTWGDDFHTFPHPERARPERGESWDRAERENHEAKYERLEKISKIHENSINLMAMTGWEVVNTNRNYSDNHWLTTLKREVGN